MLRDGQPKNDRKGGEIITRKQKPHDLGKTPRMDVSGTLIPRTLGERRAKPTGTISAKLRHECESLDSGRLASSDDYAHPGSTEF